MLQGPQTDAMTLLWETDADAAAAAVESDRSPISVGGGAEVGGARTEGPLAGRGTEWGKGVGIT